LPIISGFFFTFNVKLILQMFPYFNKDVIIAPITPEGHSAIAVIRLSGQNSISLCSLVFSNKKILTSKSHSIHYGFIIDNNKPIDEVMISIFHAPKSFTTEESVEISCHGSPIIVNEIINLLVRKGARNAYPGEFSFRAFINGRIDLSQAEAIADIIASESKAAYQIALDNLRGGVSNKLKELRLSLIDFTALIELELDFGEEDVEFADREKLNGLLSTLLTEIHNLIQSFKYGNALKNGVKVAIAGRPNAGKSSWINALAQDEIAIVSEIAGTTRDKIETTLQINGVLFRLIDTAGIRETEDTIEKIGVKKAMEAVESSNILLYIFDVNDFSLEMLEQDIEKIIQDKSLSTIIIANKSDLVVERFEKVKNEYNAYKNILFLSAKKEEDVLELKETLFNHFKNEFASTEQSTILTNSRHVESLEKAFNNLQKAQTALHDGLSGDLLSQDLKVVLKSIGEITGDIDVDTDILSSIFGRFCIGK
jgi:tRNA modification GTPase